MYDDLEFSYLVGKTPKSIYSSVGLIAFLMEDDRLFVMFHSQDCCESVSVDDINGDLLSLCGNKIVYALESSKKSNVDEYRTETWTFYKIQSSNGFWVDIRWHGSSNGCYSEAVSLVEMDIDELRSGIYNFSYKEELTEWLNGVLTKVAEPLSTHQYIKAWSI